MFAGTPYAHDPLGTKNSFDATTGEMLKSFLSQLVCALNAILVSWATWSRPPMATYDGCSAISPTIRSRRPP